MLLEVKNFVWKGVFPKFGRGLLCGEGEIPKFFLSPQLCENCVCVG
jgi:hypothetical protein